ncbi:MAG: hypothetical protein AB1696_19650 [Planctomycetota bacterium]
MKDHWGPFSEIPITAPVPRPPEPIPFGWYVNVPETPGGYVHVLLQEYERKHPDETDESDKMYRWLFCGYSREEEKAVRYFAEKGLTIILVCVVDHPPSREAAIEAVKQLADLNCKKAIPFLISALEEKIGHPYASTKDGKVTLTWPSERQEEHPETLSKGYRIYREYDKALSKRWMIKIIKALEKLAETEFGPVDVENKEQVWELVIRRARYEIWEQNKDKWSQLNKPRDDWDWEWLRRAWQNHIEGKTEETQELKPGNPKE